VFKLLEEFGPLFGDPNEPPVESKDDTDESSPVVGREGIGSEYIRDT
jgi:hypothetical protein